jgi:hypothetical protein
MSITSITGSLLNSVSSVSPTSATPPISAVDSDGEGNGSARLSGLAQAMSRLQSLEKSDPAKAKQVLSDIANKLQARAKQLGGADGARLETLAGKFQQAAASGDLSALQPAGQAQAGQQGGHHGHHGHHGRAQSAHGQAQAQAPAQSALDIINGALAGAGV